MHELVDCCPDFREVLLVRISCSANMAFRSMAFAQKGIWSGKPRTRFGRASMKAATLFGPESPGESQATEFTSLFPKGPCTQIVYTLSPMFRYREYFKAKVYTIWAHGPLALHVLQARCATITLTLQTQPFFRLPSKSELKLQLLVVKLLPNPKP